MGVKKKGRPAFVALPRVWADRFEYNAAGSAARNAEGEQLGSWPDDSAPQSSL